MKSIIIKIVIVSLVIITLISFFYTNKRFAFSMPFDNEYRFDYPSKIILDESGDFYVLDKGSKRITKISSNGNVIFTINGGRTETENIYIAYDIAVDSKKNLYVWNYVQREKQDELEEIKRYTPSGKFDTVIYSGNISDTKNKRELISFFFRKNKEKYDELVYVEKIMNDNKVSVFIKTLSKDMKKIVSNIEFPKKYDVVDMKSFDNGEIYFSEIGGKLYQRTTSGIFEPLEEEELIKKPWAVTVDNNSNDDTISGNVFVTDLINQEIVKISGNRAITFISKTDIQESLKRKDNILIKSISANKEGAIAILEEITNSIMFSNKDGKIVKVIKNGKYNSSIYLYKLFLWIVFFSAIFMIVYLISIIYTELLNRKISILLKQLFLFIPVIIISMIVITTMVYKEFYSKYEESVWNQLYSIAQVGADRISGDALEEINSAGDIKNTAYTYINDVMKKILNQGMNLWNKKLYSVVYKVIDENYYIAVGLNNYSGAFYPYPYVQKEAHKLSYEKGEYGHARFSDNFGEWMICTAPIKNVDGKIVGVYEVGMNNYIFKSANENFLKNLILGISIFTLILIIICSVFTKIILSSLAKLRNAVNEVSKGNFDAQLYIKSRDEVGELCDGFNTMSIHIKSYINEVKMLNKTYFKFVPKEFINFIDKKSIVDLKLGDSIQREMTIFFADIRSFTTLSETMSPKENFDFINAYLRRVGPIIRKNNGFIDKFIGDAIMAIFPAGPVDAVQASIEIGIKLDEYNLERIKSGYKTIAVGVGIHTGSLMFGIVGEEERVEGTVISDNVNLASRLEGLTKKYGATVIISQNSLWQSKNIEKYNYRFLDRVRVKGKLESVSIYEIIGDEAKEINRLKIETKDDFEKAVSKFFNREISEAHGLFKKIYSLNRYDKAIGIYIERCEKLIKDGMPDNWNGIESVSEK